jgi:hypothetical protein
MKLRRFAGAVAALSLLAVAAAGSAAQARTVNIAEYKLPSTRLDQLRTDWADQITARYPAGSWAPMKFDLTDRDLRLMGLPSKRVLTSHRYPVPTAVYPDGKMVPLSANASRSSKSKGGGSGGKGSGSGSTGGTAAPGVATFAGTGFFGIRPGAWLLTVTDNEVGWCSMAHVYGAPGSYQISTAGHCGKTGDYGTVIGAVGNKTVNGVPVPVLLDFGKYSHSTGDAGIGKDWALISVDPQYQSLVTPTMAFWGGPIGMYTTTGEVVSANLLAPHGPQVSTNPNPTLVQGIVHYGHGAGVGAGGTPRAGIALNWRSNYFTFFGAITPGDSGSGSNTLTGDALGDNREAAGINTHIYVDGSLKTGLGNVAGTRATQVQATLANGQILPYPAPTPVPLP